MVLVLEGMISGFGWRDALLILAVVQLVVCLPLAMSIRDKPADLGLLPDGEVVDQEAGAPPVAPAAEGLTLREALRLRAFWQMALAVMLVNVGMIAVIVHQIPFFTETLGVADGTAAALVTAMTFTSLLGRFGMGQLADMIDKRRVLAISFATCALALVLFATMTEAWQIAYALPVFAIGWGGIIPVRPAFQAEFFGMRAFGAIQGIVFTVATLGGLVGPVFAGWMYDETESYRTAFLVLSLAALAAVPMVLTIRRPEWEGGS
jgi:MFS family permease